MNRRLTIVMKAHTFVALANCGSSQTGLQISPTFSISNSQFCGSSKPRLSRILVYALSPAFPRPASPLPAFRSPTQNLFLDSFFDHSLDMSISDKLFISDVIWNSHNPLSARLLSLKCCSLL